MRKPCAAALSLLVLIAAGSQASERLVAKLDPGLVPHTFLVSPDGLRFGYVVRTAGGMAVVVDGQVGKSYPFAGAPAFSGDGGSVAYSASTSADAGMCRPPREGCAWFVVKDGQEGAPHDATSRPVLSHDGRHVAYAAQAGNRWSVVVNGRETHSHDGRVPALLGRAPEAIVYTARSGDQVIQHVEPQERQIDDGFPLHARLVIDGANTLRYLRAGDRRSIYLVEQPLE